MDKQFQSVEAMIHFWVLKEEEKMRLKGSRKGVVVCEEKGCKSKDTLLRD